MMDTEQYTSPSSLSLYWVLLSQGKTRIHMDGSGVVND